MEHRTKWKSVSERVRKNANAKIFRRTVNSQFDERCNRKKNSDARKEEKKHWKIRIQIPALCVYFLACAMSVWRCSPSTFLWKQQQVNRMLVVCLFSLCSDCNRSQKCYAHISWCGSFVSTIFEYFVYLYVYWAASIHIYSIHINHLSSRCVFAIVSKSECFSLDCVYGL